MRQILPTCLSALVCLTPLFADTLVLRDGREFEGEIVNETPLEVTFRYEDERFPGVRKVEAFSRENILRLSETTPDEVAAEALMELYPAPELLDEAGYRERVEQVEAFLEEFPDSRQRSQVERIHERLKEEMARTARGEIQLGGDWLGAHQVANRAPEINATKRLIALQEALEDQEWPQTMGVFDDIEQHYRGTAAYLEAREEALGRAGGGFLARYRSALALTREEALSDDGEDVSNEEQAEAEAEAYERQRDAESDAGRRWLSINPADPEQIDEAIQLTIAEEERLAAEDEAALRALGRQLDSIYEFLDNREIEAAQQAVEELADQDEVEVGPLVIQALEERIEKLPGEAPVEESGSGEEGEEDESGEEPSEDGAEDSEEDEEVDAGTESGDDAASEEDAIDAGSTEEAGEDPDAAAEEDAAPVASDADDRPAAPVAEEKGSPLVLIAIGVVVLLGIGLVVLLVAKKSSKGGAAKPKATSAGSAAPAPGQSAPGAAPATPESTAPSEAAASSPSPARPEAAEPEPPKPEPPKPEPPKPRPPKP